MNTSYSLKILIALKDNELTLYDLSRVLGSYGKRVSSGSLIPALKKLENSGYIFSKVEGRYKRYKITEKGNKYLSSLSDVRDKIKEDLLENLTKQNLIASQSVDFHDFLLDEKLMLDVREFINNYSFMLNFIVTRTFLLYREGRISKVEEFFKLAKEVLN